MGLDYYILTPECSVLTDVVEVFESLVAKHGPSFEPTPTRRVVAVIRMMPDRLPIGARVLWFPDCIEEVEMTLGISVREARAGDRRPLVVAPTESTPPTISATQVRLWLVRAGIPLNAVSASIDAIADPQTREETRVQWEYAPYLERNHPVVNAIGEALGLDSEQIDKAFLEASLI